jgi:hypothetical protein
VSRPIREREHGVLLADLAHLTAGLNALESQASETRAAMARLTDSIAARAKVLALSEERVEMRQKVDRLGYGSRAEIIDAAERHESEVTDQVEEQGKLSESTATLAATEKKMTELIAQIHCRSKREARAGRAEARSLG